MDIVGGTVVARWRNPTDTMGDALAYTFSDFGFPGHATNVTSLGCFGFGPFAVRPGATNEVLSGSSGAPLKRCIDGGET